MALKLIRMSLGVVSDARAILERSTVAVLRQIPIVSLELT
jgi:hypothetical protein